MFYLNKKIFFLISISLFCSILCGYAGGKFNASDNGRRKNIYMVEKSQKEIERKAKNIRKQVNKMNIDEKIGQMVIAGLDGYSVDDKTRKMIDEYKVGGFILFGNNIKNSGQLLSLLNSLKSLNAKNKTPLFLCVDEEGGRVSRMPDEFKKLPSNKAIGKINNKEFSYKVGNIIAEEIKALGFNMNFAPVLDISSNPQNRVIGDRAFGDNPQIVSSLGNETLKGMRQGNVIPVVKHFPGHGDTYIDSHEELPYINSDLKKLKNFELIPFIEAVKNDADAVMAAHILLSKIDSKNPASLSKKIITDILRKELNFNGVIITDDMTMGAVVKNYNIGDAAVKSVNAGSDIILVCHDYEKILQVIQSLKKAVENGGIPRKRIDESVYRILKLKDKYNLRDSRNKSVDVEKINNKISEILNAK